MPVTVTGTGETPGVSVIHPQKQVLRSTDATLGCVSAVAGVSPTVVREPQPRPRITLDAMQRLMCGLTPKDESETVSALEDLINITARGTKGHEGEDHYEYAYRLLLRYPTYAAYTEYAPWRRWLQREAKKCVEALNIPGGMQARRLMNDEDRPQLLEVLQTAFSRVTKVEATQSPTVAVSRELWHLCWKSLASSGVRMINVYS